MGPGMRTTLLACAALLSFLAAGCKGDAGSDGTSCTVTDNGDGTATIECEDGTTVTVTDGSDGEDGASCTIVDNGDGTKTITCDDGTVIVTDGEDGQDGDNGNNGQNGEDGEPGENGGGAEITLHHGSAFLAEEAFINDGKFLAVATIDSVTADVAGVVTVNFTVETEDGDPVTNVPSVQANIAKLLPRTASEAWNKWVPYLYRTQTTSGLAACQAGPTPEDCWSVPDGTAGVQGTRENTGTFTNHNDGTYTYVFAKNLTTVTTPVAVSYERDRLHRVSIMMGGHDGPTATAFKDFVPDGSTVTEKRDIVLTSACKSCHGEEFHGHGGDRLLVENCVTCHDPGSVDPHSGESIDLKVMIHKIHAGSELKSIPGADGIVWDNPSTPGDESADNGEYAIWGNGNSKHDWWKVGFPALPNNCSKCHEGASQSDNYKTNMSRMACGSCHDDIDFTQTNMNAPDYHPGGNQVNDNSCGLTNCHGTFYAVATVHSPTYMDPRKVPEFEATLTMTPPANGQYYTGSEAPVVTIELEEDGVAIDHNLVAGSAQGCTPVCEVPLCPPNPKTCPDDTDGKFATTNFFVSGPRTKRMPVLTTAARAQIFSTSAGPFDLDVGDTLVVKLDQGQDLIKQDAAGTIVPGTVTVTVGASGWANIDAATPTEMAAWLNANAAFAARAIAYVQNSKLGIRSRNLGRVFALQLQSSNVATKVFGGDLLTKAPTGSTPSNKLAAQTDPTTNDPKVTRSGANITYQLDPVGDLPAGTYTVFIEISRLGRVSETVYRTPTVLEINFQVGQAAEELPPARNCSSCHQSSTGVAFVLDYPRHNKIFDDDALDQCGNCHDYQPQTFPGMSGHPTNGTWSGSRPISKRVHAVHYGSSLNYPLKTVDYSGGDPIAGRNWDITYPQDVRNCETCHPDADSSGTWATEPGRLPCSGCHDDDDTAIHMKINTWDPTPSDPWSGDEQESCTVCH